MNGSDKNIPKVCRECKNCERYTDGYALNYSWVPYKWRCKTKGECRGMSINTTECDEFCGKNETQKPKCANCVFSVNNDHCGLKDFTAEYPRFNQCSAFAKEKHIDFILGEDGYFTWRNKGILKNAKFGEMFLTRNGRKAVLVETPCILWVEGVDGEHQYSENGCYSFYGTKESDLDIVSKII